MQFFDSKSSLNGSVQVKLTLRILEQVLKTSQELQKMNAPASKNPVSGLVTAIFRDRVATAFVLLVGLIVFGAVINPGFLSFLQMI